MSPFKTGRPQDHSHARERRRGVEGEPAGGALAAAAGRRGPEGELVTGSEINDWLLSITRTT